MSRSVRIGDGEEGSVFDRSITWLCQRLLGDEELPGKAGDVEDPDVIRLMAHQHSFLM